MEFSKELISNAVSSESGELAWKKAYVFEAVEEITAKNWAILGGEVWALVKRGSENLVLTEIDYENIAVGVIPGADGQDYVFNWHSDKNPNEAWDDFVGRSKKETIESISSLKTEETVRHDLRNSIYYNLVFVDEVEYQELEMSTNHA